LAVRRFLSQIILIHIDLIQGIDDLSCLFRAIVQRLAAQRVAGNLRINGSLSNPMRAEVGNWANASFARALTTTSGERANSQISLGAKTRQSICQSVHACVIALIVGPSDQLSEDFSRPGFLLQYSGTRISYMTKLGAFLPGQ
jgi:hypothetical protein